MQRADTIFVNGRFLTMENENEIAEAVAVAGGRILFVGSEEDAQAFADEDTRLVDLGGRVACPGLIDCHTHPMGSFTSRFITIDIRGEKTASLKNLLACLAEKAKTTPEGEWIVGRGYDESKFAEGEITITADMLDQVSDRHPICITRTCGHIGVVNHMALKLAGLTDESPNPAAGGHLFRDENGCLTGMLSGSALGKIPTPAIKASQKKEAMISGVQADYFSKGIVATGEMGSVPTSFRYMQQLEKEERLKLRVGYYYVGRRSGNAQPMAQRMMDMGLTTGFGTDHVRFMGIKFVMDGSTGGHTAAFSKNYLGEPDNFGELYFDPAILREDLLKAAKGGVQVSIHAIGDRAIEMALSAIEYVNEQGVDTRPLRYRLEHVESPTPDQIQRIKKLNISVALSSAFIYSLGDSHLTALGYDRLVDAFPAKTLMDEGIVVACNSDCPVCDVNPMLGIYSMVTRTTEKGQSFGGKKEAVSRIAALESYTKNAAYVLCCENTSGTLKAGKFADLTVFEDDFLAVPDEALKDVRIHMTVSGGEIVYQN